MYYRIFLPSNELVPNADVDAQLEVNRLAPTGTAYDPYERDVLEEVLQS